MIPELKTLPCGLVQRTRRNLETADARVYRISYDVPLVSGDAEMQGRRQLTNPICIEACRQCSTLNVSRMGLKRIV